MREPVNLNLTYKEVDDKIIRGRFINVFINRIVFSQIFVYQDSSINYWGIFTRNLEEIKKEIASGFISAVLPQNETILLPEIGSLQRYNFFPLKTNEDLVKEIEDAIVELNGGKGRIWLLRESIESFFRSPTEENWNCLRLAYQDAQTNVKNTLLEMDSRKCPLPHIIDNKSAYIGQDMSYFIDNYL